MPTGVLSTNVSMLQQKFDEEFAAAEKNYEMYLKRKAKTEDMKEKENEVREAMEEEKEALSKDANATRWYKLVRDESFDICRKL